MKQLLKKSAIWIVAAFVIFFLPIIFSSGYAHSLMGMIGVMIIFSLSYNMMLGQGGMLSFGHAVYLGLSGYFTIHLLMLIDDGAIVYIPISLLPLFGGLVGLLFGILIGFVSTRRAGTIFAMISLGFVEMMTALAFILISFFNGEEGIQGDRMIGPEPFGITYGPAVQVCYLIGFWVFVAMLTMYAITKTPFGRISNAVRDNPERAQFIGYNTQRVRWLAFSLAAFFAGIAGGLFALHFEHVGYEASGLHLSGEVLFATYIGGISTFLGPIVGAAVFTFLKAVLSEVSNVWHLYLGAIFLLTVIFAPSGIAGLVLMHEPIWKVDFRLLRRLALPYLGSLVAILLATCGIIGFIEVINFVADEYATGNVLNFLGVEIAPYSVMTWVIFGIITIIGIGLCKVVFPAVLRNWNAIMETVKERMLQ